MNTLQQIAAAGVAALSVLSVALINPAPPPLITTASADAYHFVDVGNMVEPTLEELADIAALEAGIPTTTLRNLVWSESRWSTTTVGGLGELGLVQILPESNPTISEEQALDPKFSLSWAAGRLADGEEWRWTVCSCVKMVRVFVGPGLPRQDAKDFIPNATPQVGGVVIYKYSNGASHIAYIAGFTPDGSGWYEKGSNLEPCLSYERIGRFDDPALVGFAYYQ